MSNKGNGKIDRRDFLKKSAVAAATLSAGFDVNPVKAFSRNKRVHRGKKVIVIGVDGMDPRLSESMMNDGLLPTFDKLRRLGGYRVLGTTIPPQSPVAWASFINGAGPGSHGIFDFIHRDPKRQCAPFFSASETLQGEGYWELGDHKLQLDFWPFNHKPKETLLKRQGVPFWDYLDQAGIFSVFYDLPSNYPPSPSKYGFHRSLSGMGTPDMFGAYGIYQHFSENQKDYSIDKGGGKHYKLFFNNDTAVAELVGPKNSYFKQPQDTKIKFTIHRDSKARAAVIKILDNVIVLKEGVWSKWLKLDFKLAMPSFMPDEHLSGICRFYLQEIDPNFRLYITPINIDPSDPAIQITEPPDFIIDISKELSLFYTTGFQEDHKALSNKVFTDAEFAEQANMVLEERLRLLEYAIKDYDDGFLFFYFSSTDLQAHMFWWDSDEKHPVRSCEEAKKYFNKLKEVYRRMDSVMGDIIERYGDKATIMIVSDHGFSNFKRQFNLNTWLKENGYIQPADCTSIMYDTDWTRTKAYGLGINGLYLNLNGRERAGVVQPGHERDKLIDELVNGLEAVRDKDGRRVIRKVHFADNIYKGAATEYAPDLVIGYSRDYRASWDTCLGKMTSEVIMDNDSAWSADHCADVTEVPGVIFSNRPIRARAPSLIDIAPSVLGEFGLRIPESMEGINIFRA